jgi:hypothetical protein
MPRALLGTLEDASGWRHAAAGGRCCCCLRTVHLDSCGGFRDCLARHELSVVCGLQVVLMDEDDEVVFGHGRSKALGASLKALATSPSPAYVVYLSIVLCSIALGQTARVLLRLAGRNLTADRCMSAGHRLLARDWQRALHRRRVCRGSSGRIRAASRSSSRQHSPALPVPCRRAQAVSVPGWAASRRAQTSAACRLRIAFGVSPTLAESE